MSEHDPRAWPALTDAPDEFVRLFALADASLTAATGRDSAACDAKIAAALDALVRGGDGARLARLFALTPSAVVHRHLWRLLAAREHAPRSNQSLAVRLFAMPIVIVAGNDTETEAQLTLPMVLNDVDALAASLREHGALGGGTTFALGDALVAADAIDLAQLPGLLARSGLSDAPLPPLSLAPAPIVVAGRAEGVHLRFVVGAALAASTADLLRDACVGKWGIPFAQALARQLAMPSASLLALPRAPQSLVRSVAQGRAAQREVAAQLFAGNAIRQLRATVGEPTAMISVHRVAAPEGGGEVRLSLSSPFDPRAAEGFRCPLLPLDQVDDVVRLLADLMRDCRVRDVRIVPGIHADRDPETGLPLLFKGDGPSAQAAVH